MVKSGSHLQPERLAASSVGQATAVLAEKESPADHPPISVVVPSLNGETSELERRLTIQTWVPDQVKVVRGVTPNGRARNLGVAATRGDILLFIDDDALPGRRELVEGLVRPLLEDPTIGVTGAARVLPANAPRFQRRVAREIPRTVNPIPDEPLETNPPLVGYGHSLITTTCAAMRRSVYKEVGGFDDSLPSGVDTDMFYRIRKQGYRFVMVPQVYVEHPAPESLSALLRKFHWYGVGYGREVQQRPQQRMGFRLPTRLHRAAFLIAATLWVVPNMFIPYSLSYRHWRPGFRPVKALATYAAAWGYVHSWGRKIR